MGIKNGIVHSLMPVPIGVRHGEYSMVFSADDDPGRPDDYLIETALKSAKAAHSISLADIQRRGGASAPFVDVWPGEHYRLLAGLVQTLQPKSVIEVGTATGASALALKAYLPDDGKISTFDVIRWQDVPGFVLAEADFSDGRLVQYSDDLTSQDGFRDQIGLIQSADLIFIDAAKDGSMELRLLNNLASWELPRQPLIVFDDIRLWNMLKIWREIKQPKLDLTSFVIGPAPAWCIGYIPK